MKRALCALLALLMFVVPIGFAAAETLEMDVYLIDPCGGCGKVGIGCKSCTIVDEIANRYRALFSQYDVLFHFTNLRMDNTQEEAMWARIGQFGLSSGEILLPVVFVGDGLFAADGSMDEMIAEYVRTGEDPGAAELIRRRAEFESRRVPGRVVYLYSAYCEDCRDISKWLAFSLPPDYEVVKYDIYTEAGQAMERYVLEELGVSRDEYCVPCILYGDECFAGKRSIYLSLKNRIQEYPDLQTVILEELEG